MKIKPFFLPAIILLILSFVVISKSQLIKASVNKNDKLNPLIEAKIDQAIENNIILCTGPSLFRKRLLKKNTLKDMKHVPFKKIFLSTNDSNNMDIKFKDKKPVCELLSDRTDQIIIEAQQDCLNCIITTIKNAVNDPECNDDDIILFKHESLFINDMNLFRKAIGKILEGYDVVARTQRIFGPGTFYCTDGFFMRLGAAKKVFQNHPKVTSFNDDYRFCEEYFTKYIVKLFPKEKVFAIDFNHYAWKDGELGLHHMHRFEINRRLFWDKKNYNDLYR